LRHSVVLKDQMPASHPMWRLTQVMQLQHRPL